MKGNIITIHYFYIIYNIKPNVDQRIFSNSEGQYLTLHYFSNQTKCKPKPPCRSFDLYEANQMETKRKNFEKNHIFQDKKYTENVNYNRIHMDTMLTPSKIGTKIRCIITCCVRGNVDEDVDGGCKSDTDDE